MTPISFDSHGTLIHGELYSPAGPGTGKAIVAIHGLDGIIEPWGSTIREIRSGQVHKGENSLTLAGIAFLHKHEPDDY